MYAIVRSGGKQLKVAAGDVVSGQLRRVNIWREALTAGPARALRSFVLTQIIWVHIVEVMRVLPAPSAWAGPLPEAAPPADMAIYQLPTGTYETRAAFAVSGT